MWGYFLVFPITAAAGAQHPSELRAFSLEKELSFSKSTWTTYRLMPVVYLGLCFHLSLSTKISRPHMKVHAIWNFFTKPLTVAGFVLDWSTFAHLYSRISRWDQGNSRHCFLHAHPRETPRMRSGVVLINDCPLVGAGEKWLAPPKSQNCTQCRKRVAAFEVVRFL